MPTCEEIRDSLTSDQMRAYMATIHHLKHEDPARFMGNEAMRHRAAAMAYAGKNPMLHHRQNITDGGLGGLAQLLANRGTVASAKIAAADWIIAARQNRALGFKGAAVAGYLNRAAEARHAALVRAGVAA